MHLLGAELRRSLPESGCLISAMCSLPALRRGVRLAVAAAPAAFHDIGTPAQYLAANVAWLGGRPSFCGDGAEVEPGVRLERGAAW